MVLYIPQGCRFKISTSKLGRSDNFLNGGKLFPKERTEAFAADVVLHLVYYRVA